MTNKELERIEMMAEAAAPGPWGDLPHGYRTDIVFWGTDTDGNKVAYPIFETRTNAKRADILFVANARTDILTLITEINRLQAIERAVIGYVTADGPETYQAYEELRKLVLAQGGKNP